MLFKKIFLDILYFIKKMYLLLFNFMIGNETRKFYRFFVHLMMTALLIFIYAYFSAIAQLFTGEVVFTIERLIFILVAPLGPVLLACSVKLMMMYWV